MALEECLSIPLILSYLALLQAIAYNPVYPALLAAGSANGDIFVWDTCCEDEDRTVGSSTSSTADCMHRQSVQCVEWVHSAEEATHYAQASRAFLLCSVGRCGRPLSTAQGTPCESVCGIELGC